MDNFRYVEQFYKMKLIDEFHALGGEFRGAPTATTIHDTHPLNRRSGSGHGSHLGYADGPSHAGNNDDYNER